jgi:hypothetical protein
VVPSPGDRIYSDDIATLTTATSASGANTATFSNTTPSVQSPTVGTAFTAPPSGKVLVLGHCYVANRNALYATYGGVRVKTGAVLDSGTTVLDPTVEPAAKITVELFVGRIEATTVQTLTALTPGASYNACMVGWVSNAAATGDHFSRRVEIINQ